MKTLLRTSALAAALSLSALAASHAFVTPSYGTCKTFCTNPATHTFSQVSWYTTETQCCNGSVNPCPAGTTPGGSSFQPTSGFARLCPIN
ncbi:MAG TPA: hypothetical protein VGG20_13550 [Thermoanaerobaculia bacterium]|jgi:hypothetical protein